MPAGTSPPVLGSAGKRKCGPVWLVSLPQPWGWVWILKLAAAEWLPTLVGVDIAAWHRRRTYGEFYGNCGICGWFNVEQILQSRSGAAALAVAAGGDGGVPFLGGPSKVESVQVHSGSEESILGQYLIFGCYWLCIIFAYVISFSWNLWKISISVCFTTVWTLEKYRIRSRNHFQWQPISESKAAFGTSAKSGINSRTTSEELSESHTQYRHELFSVFEPNQESTDNISIESNQHKAGWFQKQESKH